MVFFVAGSALAQPDLGINSLAEGGVSLGRGSIYVIVGRIVQAALGLIGMIFTILIIYGGWLWMTSYGDPKQIEKAKKTIINSVIGLAIILSSLAISQFIISRLIAATTGGAAGEGGIGAYSQPLSGSLGAGIIQSHVPERGATAPRNTKVAVTFKEPIDEKSLIADTNNNGIYGDGADLASKAVFKMAKTSVLKQNNNNFKNVPDADLVAPAVYFTPDKLNFIFAPTALLGDPSETVSYTVFITDGLKKADGAKAFSNVFAGGYMWEFQVEPKIDNIPPRVLSVIPYRSISPRNSVVQINFDEAIDPTSASGQTLARGGGFQNIVLQSGASVLAGSYKISNAYKTVEFVTNDLCGINSCGGGIYCLPANALIAGLIKAATLGDAPPQAAGFPYDGVVDLAGNSMDGNGNGKTEGPRSAYVWNGGDTTVGDNISWQFSTNDLIDLAPPVISKIDPGINAQNVGLSAPINITFSKLMSSYTLNNSNVNITHNVPAPYELWYGVNTAGLDANDNPAVSDPIKTRATVVHGQFAPSVLGGNQYQYYPSANSKVQDLRQNCFNPSAGPSCAPTAAAPYCCNGVAQAAKCGYIP